MTVHNYVARWQHKCSVPVVFGGQRGNPAIAAVVDTIEFYTKNARANYDAVCRF